MSQAGATQQSSDPSQFNTDRTYPGRWTITFSNPPINMFVPATIVELGALMTDLEADPSVKVVTRGCCGLSFGLVPTWEVTAFSVLIRPGS
jgi:hypothetical protein